MLRIVDGFFEDKMKTTPSNAEILGHDEQFATKLCKHDVYNFNYT